MNPTQHVYETLVRPSIVEGETHVNLFSIGRSVCIDWAFGWILEALTGHPERATSRLRERIYFVIEDHKDEARAAMEVRRIIAEHIDEDHFKRQQKKRAKTVAEAVLCYIENDDRVLDYGCGDAVVALAMNLHRPGPEMIALYDVSDRLHEDARDRDHMPFICGIDKRERLTKLGLFNAIVLSSVLHHMEDPDAELKEHIVPLLAPGGRLIAIESVISPFIPDPVLAFVDWFFNRCLVPGTFIPVPGTWKTQYAWEHLFVQLGLEKVKTQRRLSIELATAPEDNRIMVWRKPE